MPISAWLPPMLLNVHVVDTELAQGVPQVQAEPDLPPTPLPRGGCASAVSA